MTARADQHRLPRAITSKRVWRAGLLCAVGMLLCANAATVSATQYPSVGFRLDADPNSLPIPGEVFRASL